MRRLTKLALIALAAAPAGALVAAVWLDNSGFCFPQRRFLSDAEKIEAAANYARNGFHIVFLVPQGDGRKAEVSAHTPVYASATEFMTANPGCCRMAGLGNPAELRHPEWIEREGRWPERSVVVIDMAVPFTGPDGERRTATFRTNIAIKPCGHVVPRRLFERVARLERKAIFG